MAEETPPKAGTIGWTDLTVENADLVCDFYAAVTGWRPEPVDMGGYSDYNMVSAATGEPAAGICHKRGTNAELPSQWMIYIVVEDLDESLARCRKLGGKVVLEPKGMGGSSRYCVIEDPAGAVAALYQPEPTD